MIFIYVVKGIFFPSYYFNTVYGDGINLIISISYKIKRCAAAGGKKSFTVATNMATKAARWQTNP